MQCAAHPEVETNLSCGRCGVPICPRCMVQTPVGARCRKCAGLKRLPTYEIGVRQYLRASGVGLGFSVVIGIAWGWLWRFLAFYLFGLVLAAGIGFAIAEVLSLSVNRKRGRTLQAIGGLCVVVSYLVANVWLSGGSLTFFDDFSFFDLVALAVGIFMAATRLQ